MDNCCPPVVSHEIHESCIEGDAPGALDVLDSSSTRCRRLLALALAVGVLFVLLEVTSVWENLPRYTNATGVPK